MINRFRIKELSSNTKSKTRTERINKVPAEYQLKKSKRKPGNQDISLSKSINNETLSLKTEVCGLTLSEYFKTCNVQNLIGEKEDSLHLIPCMKIKEVD